MFYSYQVTKTRKAQKEKRKRKTMNIIFLGIELLGFRDYYQNVGEQINLMVPKTKHKVDQPNMTANEN